MLEDITFHQDRISIKLIPTFMGCPALDIIKKNVEETVAKVKADEKIEVIFALHPPWTSDRITDTGRERLKEFGIAPPPIYIAESGEWQADCPYCGSTYTTLENLFGPTACRSILYCKACKNPFEAMKPVSTLM